MHFRVDGMERSRRGQVLPMVWLVLTLVFLIAGESESLAHDQDDRRVSQVESGQLTGVSNRGVQINRRDYGLHPKVILQDDEGRPKQLQDFKAGMFVQYQLKDDLVRQLILVTPK